MTTPAERLQERAAKAMELLTTRKREEEAFATGRQNKNHHQGPHMDIDAVMKGVTIGWLAQAMDMNHDQVKKKLRECPPLRAYKNGYIYDFKVAVSYLVKPRFDIDAYLKQARIEDLPIRLQTEYWAAKNRRREYEENAGQLWRSEQVLEVLGEVFKMIKLALQLWSQNLESTAGLSDTQRKVLQKMVDKLQDDIYKRSVKIAGNRKTKSVLKEDLDAEALEEAVAATGEYVEDEDEDSIIASVV